MWAMRGCRVRMDGRLGVPCGCRVQVCLRSVGGDLSDNGAFGPIVGRSGRNAAMRFWYRVASHNHLLSDDGRFWGAGGVGQKPRGALFGVLWVAADGGCVAGEFDTRFGDGAAALVAHSGEDGDGEGAGGLVAAGQFGGVADGVVAFGGGGSQADLDGGRAGGGASSSATASTVAAMVAAASSTVSGSAG